MRRRQIARLLAQNARSTCARCGAAVAPERVVSLGAAWDVKYCDACGFRGALPAVPVQRSSAD